MAESGGDTELCAVLPGWAFGPVRPPAGGLGSVQVVERLMTGRLRTRWRRVPAV